MEMTTRFASKVCQNIMLKPLSFHNSSLSAWRAIGASNRLFSSKHVRDSQVRDLSLKLRGVGGTSVPPDQFVRLLESVEKFSTSSGLLDAYVYGFEKICLDLSLDDLLHIVERLWAIPHFRFLGHLMEVIRVVLFRVSSYGVSSFSLDSILLYAKLCYRLKTSPEKMFADSLCSRVVSQLSSVDETLAVHLAEYVIELCVYWPKNELLQAEVAKLSGSPILERISLNSLSQLEAIFPLQLSTAVLTSIAARPVSQLLVELRSIEYSKTFSEIIAACDEKAPFKDSKDNQNYLSICAKRFYVPGVLAEVVNSALTDVDALPDVLNSLAKLGPPLEIPIKRRIAECVNDWISPTADLMTVVGYLSELEIHSIDLVGPIMKHSENYVADKAAQSWKLAVWWRLVDNGYNSILPEVIRKEFPKTWTNMQSSCQPMPNNLHRITQLINKLKMEQIVHTSLSNVKFSPIRAHATIKLTNGRTCYIFATKEDGRIVSVSSDARLTLKMVKKFVSEAHAELSLIPLTKLTKDVPILELVNSNLVV